MLSDLSSTSCEDWGRIFFLAQIYTHILYLPSCKQLNQNKVAFLSYFTLERTGKRENPLVYCSVLSPVSAPVLSVLVFLHFSPGSGMNMAQTCGLPIARVLSCFPYSTLFLNIFVPDTRPD